MQSIFLNVGILVLLLLILRVIDKRVVKESKSSKRLYRIALLVGVITYFIKPIILNRFDANTATNRFVFTALVALGSIAIIALYEIRKNIKSIKVMRDILLKSNR